MATSSPSAILLISCPDCSGIVARMSAFVRDNKGNIVHLDQHVDTEESVFFMRMEWSLEDFAISRKDLPGALEKFTASFAMSWSLHFSEERPRVALLVSKESHCLYDLLSRHESGELRMEIPLIIGNHEHLRPAAERFNIPFHHLPITKATKAEQEGKEFSLLDEHGVDTIVLARYMQILSEDFVARYPNRIINIHHSFLPAFPGARPYHSAYRRGVKIIGATSHYVTPELDEGPIIAQDVTSVSHKDSITDFLRHGKDLEKIVLARALWSHVEHKVLVYENKTVVFD
ncbi:MAG: formyltetrahydrofolate deformylase [Verrucomicrobiales bacterium]